MPTWHLVRQQPDDQWVDTGQTCTATDWHGAVYQLLADHLIGRPPMLDIVDLFNGNSDTLIRAGCSRYRIIRVDELDDELAYTALRERLELDAAEQMRQIRGME